MGCSEAVDRVRDRVGVVRARRPIRLAHHFGIPAGRIAEDIVGVWLGHLARMQALFADDERA